MYWILPAVGIIIRCSIIAILLKLVKLGMKEFVMIELTQEKRIYFYIVFHTRMLFMRNTASPVTFAKWYKYSPVYVVPAH
jgi:hypothetical protein